MKRGIALAVAVLTTVLAAPAAFAQEPAALAADPPYAPIPTLADGRPDFTGVWTMRMPGGGLQAINDLRGICVINCGPPGARGARPPANFPKYRPELVERVAALNRAQVREDPALRCQNPGLPRIGPPDKIVQRPNELVILYDDLNGAYWRIIPTDGRRHDPDAEQSLLGQSVGRWEGNKLVIETISFNDVSWLTDNGAFHSENMRIVEELTADGGNINYVLTVHDPDVLAEPWVKSAKLNPARNNPLEPAPCIEQSIDRMVGDESYHPNTRW